MAGTLKSSYVWRALDLPRAAAPRSVVVMRESQQERLDPAIGVPAPL
jgi:hypothetical protein